jgi:endonuclease YncB( thermonuclease family)
MYIHPAKIAYRARFIAPPAGPPPVPNNAYTITARHAVDGDGFWANIGHGQIMVRLLGLDAPEFDDFDRANSPIGLWSKAILAGLVNTQGLLVCADIIQPVHDRYARRLLWAWRASDLLFINAALILAGAARTRPDFPSAYTYFLQHCQRLAKAKRYGIWQHVPNAEA